MARHLLDNLHHLLLRLLFDNHIANARRTSPESLKRRMALMLHRLDRVKEVKEDI